MKYIPGHTFVAKKKMKEPFVLGSTYRIYHISPMEDKIKYMFSSSDKPLELDFPNSDVAEKIIDKVSGN